MDWHDSAEEAAFRAEVRQMIVERLPERYRALAQDQVEMGWASTWQSDHRSGDAAKETAAREWAQALGERGWVAPNWPEEYGGAGLSSTEQFILNQEMAEAAAPKVGGGGVAMLGPTIIIHGTPEQQAKYLPSILSGETVWAQGFSEPGAGSDLASLQTRAVRDGDEWVVNGQKIWTSQAHLADALFLLARSDPDAPKHRGISFLLVEDIQTPGLTVRPLINMADEHEFNETFFEDVRVPAEHHLGEVNRGWYVAMTLLDHERSNVAGAVQLRRLVERTVRHATGAGAPQTRWEGTIREQLAERYIETAVGQNFSLRIMSMGKAGLVPNYEASVSKNFMAESGQRLGRTGTTLYGLYSNLWDPDEPYAPDRAVYTRYYVNNIPSTIGGGTAEVQRNIIATRGLGLPRG